MNRAGWLPPLALGLWVSWHYSFATWSTESDAALPYVVWHGIHQYGWRFITDFQFAPDNWLAWPLPLLFAAFATVGTAPPVAFAVGWLLFVASVALAALLVRRAAGPHAGLACAAVLLLSNRAAIGELGFLTYPVSHNGPLVLGLAALLAATAWLDHPRPQTLAATTLLLTAAGLADPWTNAAVTLPLLIAATLLAARAPRRCLPLAGAAALAWAAASTRLFGLLWFLPRPPLAFASPGARLSSLAWLGRLAAMWFNAVPFWGQGYAWIANGTQTAASLALLLAAALAVAALALRPGPRSVAFRLLGLTGLASIALVCGAFVLLDFPPVISVGRFFVAAYVFAVMLAAAAAGRAWPALGRTARRCILAAALPLPLAGLASAPSAWLTWHSGTAERHFGQDVPPFDNAIPELADFLRAHGLRFGYGAYWAEEANAAAWVTGGAITLRPVAFDPATGTAAPFFAQVSPRWYAGPDGPAGDPTTFLVISPGFLACADLPLCIHAAAGQFGPPRETLRYKGSTILVWDHRIFGVTAQHP